MTYPPKSRQRRQRAHRPCVDTLEARQLLAGNVSVGVLNGDLVITGDGSSNAVEIFQVSLDRYRVVGKSTGGSATKINNVSNGSYEFYFDSLLYPFSNYKDDLVIKMNGGNDRVTIRGDSGLFGDIDARDEIRIEMGSGNDFVDLQFVEAQAGDIHIDLGTGADDVYLDNVWAGDDLRVLRPSSSTDGRAFVSISRSSINDELEVSLGKAADTVNVSRCNVGTLIAKLRDGNDKLSVRRTNVSRGSNLDGGNGTDKLNRFSNNTSLNHSNFQSFTSNDSDY